MFSPPKAPRLVLLALCALTGCTTFSKTKDQSATNAALRLSYHTGSVLAKGNQQPLTAQDIEQALQVKISFRSLEHFPEKSLGSVSFSTRVVASSASPFRAAPVGLAGSRVGRVENLNEYFGELVSTLGTMRKSDVETAALPTGVTVRAEFRQGDWQSAAATESIAVYVHKRPLAKGQSPEYEIAFERRESRRRATSEENLREQFETVVLKALTAVPSNSVILIPKPFSSSSEALAIIVEVSWPPRLGEPGFRQFRRVVAQLRRDLSDSGVDIEYPQEYLDAISSPTPMRLSGLTRKALRRPGRRRVALIRLARQCSARMTSMLTLSAPESIVAKLADKVGRHCEAASQDVTQAEFAWALERASFEVIFDLWIEDRLPPGLRSLVIRFAGGVASQPSAFMELMNSCERCRELQKVLKLRNKELLSDSSAVIRIRAYEWLRTHDTKLPGYDPLADKDARRAALETLEKREAKKS